MRRPGQGQLSAVCRVAAAGTLFRWCCLAYLACRHRCIANHLVHCCFIAQCQAANEYAEPQERVCCRSLCRRNMQPTGYKDCPFHRIIRGFMIQVRACGKVQLAAAGPAHMCSWCPADCCTACLQLWPSRRSSMLTFQLAPRARCAQQRAAAWLVCDIDLCTHPHSGCAGLCSALAMLSMITPLPIRAATSSRATAPAASPSTARASTTKTSPPSTRGPACSAWCAVHDEHSVRIAAVLCTDGAFAAVMSCSLSCKQPLLWFCSSLFASLLLPVCRPTAGPTPTAASSSSQSARQTGWVSALGRGGWQLAASSLLCAACCCHCCCAATHARCRQLLPKTNLLQACCTFTASLLD